MKNQVTINRESVFGSLRAKAEQLLKGNQQKTDAYEESEVSLLLNELEIYELELQLQNEELKASYHDLEIERLKFKGLFNAAPIGYLILNQAGYISEINQTGLQLLYYPHGQIGGKKLEAFIVQDSLHEYNAFIKKIKESSERLQCEVRLKTKKTETKYVQLDGVATTSLTENETTYYITIIDVTNAKKAQQHLWETTERLNQTLKASLTGTWMVKSKGTQIFLDEYCRNILNIKDSVEKPNLESLKALLIDEDKPKLDALISNCDDDWEIDLEFRLKKTDQKNTTVLVKGKIVNPLYGHRYFAGILTDITDRKHNLELEKEYEDKQRKLLRRAAIEAEEKERGKISAALHDSVCQILYGIRFNLNHLNKQDPFKAKLDNINEMLDSAIKELRTISVELTPSILKDFGFSAGIKDMVQRLENVGFNVDTKIDQKADLLPQETQLYIFRIIQELLNNSIKHSGANHAAVSVCTENGLVSIHVSDKGKGLEKDIEEAFKSGSGLRGIKNRVSLLNGKLEISNQNGVNFKIHFPKN